MLTIYEMRHFSPKLIKFTFHSCDLLSCLVDTWMLNSKLISAEIKVADVELQVLIFDLPPNRNKSKSEVSSGGGAQADTCRTQSRSSGVVVLV